LPSFENTLYLVPREEEALMKVLASPAFSDRASNPYCSLLYEAMQKKGVEVIEFRGLRSMREKVDLFHLHWPDLTLCMRSRTRACIESARLLVLVLWVRLRGARIVWTAHNVQSHENYHPALENVFWWFFVRELDGVISLSRAGLEEVRRKRLGRRKLAEACIALGHYRDAYPNTAGREESRRHFGIDPAAVVVGWVGQIRAYKGLAELIGVWRKSPCPERVLLIGGDAPEPEQRHALEESARPDPRIHFRPGRVDDHDLQFYFNASDVIVMPYRKILNSGSAILGLSFNRPVVLPRSEVMVELQNLVGSDWVHLYEGEFNEAVLREIFQWLERRPRLDKAPLAALDWDLLGEQTMHFFQQIISGRQHDFSID
jgi:glycosyltransferase involved in cell wall biosynthesis